MLIGLDFDNTIVCYDRLFYRLAVERGLVPMSVAAAKPAIRDYLRAAGREDEWTELQGIAYGPRIVDADPFPGVLDFLTRCRRASVRVAIISHKTRRPYRGGDHDLHAAAHAFLTSHGFYKRDETGLAPERVYFEATLAAKLLRIRSLNCAAFVDDLLELLNEPAFPSGVRRVLFDPADTHSHESRFDRARSWIECGDCLLARCEVPA
jgi:FMN phosphatase YigB (HAD superfamily)